MDIPTTTRAYTLKLSGEGDWRQLLWTTHFTVNQAARVWGDWLLTLRGGLPASLANEHPERRVILALSWLSVEAPISLVPQQQVVARADEPDEVLKRFKAILNRLQVNDPQAWLDACAPALTARIRDDAVWVDRAACFAQLQKQYQGLSSQWAADTLFAFLGDADDYFLLPDAEAAPPAEAKDFVQRAGGWLSRHWGAGQKSDSAAISRRLEQLASIEPAQIVGRSGRDALAVLLRTLGCSPSESSDQEELYRQLKRAVGWKGHPSKGANALRKIRDADHVDDELWRQTAATLRAEAEVQSSKAAGDSDALDWMRDWRTHMEATLGMPYRTDTDLIWEHGVALDHALRRVSAAHTWIKRAEVQRRRFQEDAQKITNVPQKAREWLDTFRQRRASISGALGDYLIRKRAIDGWDKVVRAWAELGPNATRHERIVAAREVQANLDEDEKFGDIQLFAGFGDDDASNPAPSLADDDAVCVWRDPDGSPNAEILKSYVAATVAQYDQGRFKVPAYRHPDPLRHPIYVDYGKSRWFVEYSALKAAHQPSKQGLDLRTVTLGVWSGTGVEKLHLRWHSKRFRADFDLDHFSDGTGDESVTRADRLGRVIAAQPPKTAVTVTRIFEQKHWNGRLQVPRDQLDRLADLVYGKHADPDLSKLQSLHSNPRARRHWEHLTWFLTTSATLQPKGPWLDYVAAGLPQGIQYKKGRNGYYLDYAANQGRKGRARLCLARLPGLRVLSLDLGHRYAAACAVWETLTRQQMIDACQAAGHPEPSGDQLYIHLRRHSQELQKSGRNKGKPVIETTIYRRIGPDRLPDGTEHPAPWARLDRQFLIKLQGEDRPARYARQDELDAVNQFRRFLGLTPLHGKPRIDDLQRDTVRLARLGLRRLGDMARIAYAMTASKKPVAGGQYVDLNAEQRAEFVQDALLRWLALAGSARYRDDWAREMWDSLIHQKLGGPQLTEIPDDLPRAQPAARVETARQALRAVAAHFSDPQSAHAIELHRLWADRWRDRQTAWRQYLRWLRRFILPRQKDCRQAGTAVRRVGGLSVKRLATIRELYQVLKAFRMRPEPDDLRKNVPLPGDRSFANFGRRILHQLQRLREQRLKQLASRVAEAALGAGRMKKSLGRDRRRPTQAVDKPCHVVVVENLQHYKPEDSRLRRENRQLMDWQARNLRKHIMEACELYGLHFVEVSPAYTSRQDSRTGAAGVRCEDVPYRVLEEAAQRVRAGDAASADSSPAKAETLSERQIRAWVAQLKRVKAASGELPPRDRILAEFLHKAATLSQPPATLRLPCRGGELFVSADPHSPLAKGIQADLNAAANIGLKALTDPDWMGAWWFVLVDRTTGQPVAEKINGCPVWTHTTPLLNPDAAATSPQSNTTRSTTRSGKSKRAKTHWYAWSDLTATQSSAKTWLPSGQYWEKIERQVVDRLLREQFDLPAENPF